jgi:hypothetical protein
MMYAVVLEFKRSSMSVYWEGEILVIGNEEKFSDDGQKFEENIV